MKLKHLLLIGLSVLGLSSLSAVTTQADSTDPDAVMPYSLSKKEFNKIKKDYKGIWNNDKYYRVNKNVKISVNFMEPNEDVPTKYMNVTIPKGTILVGSRGYTNDSKKHISYVFSIDLDSLSYYVKTPKSSPNKDYEQQSAEVDSKSSATLNKYFTRISQPKYMPSYSQGDLSKYPGDHIKFSPFTEAYQQIKVTSNGYVEYRNITDSMETGQITNPKPISSAKITGYLIKNDTRYLYYSHHITGVPDTKVAKSGNKQYRLAITNLHQPFSMFDGDQGALLFSKYQIKNTAYFTRIGAFGV